MVCRRLVKFLCLTSALLFGGVMLFLSTFRFVAPFLPYPDLSYDLTSNLNTAVADLFRNKSITAHFNVRRDAREGLHIKATGTLLDWPYILDVYGNYSLFSLAAEGSYVLMLEGTSAKLNGEFFVTPKTYRVSARMPRMTLTERDDVFGPLAKQLAGETISNLTFSADCELTAHVEKTRDVPVPVWSVQGKLTDSEASGVVRGSPFAVKGVGLVYGAEGIANHIAIQPIFVRAKSVEYAAYFAENAYLTLMKSPSAFLITEAGARMYGGDVKIYSLYLDPQRLTTGFTLMVDDIDANEVLCRIDSFSGSATGRLHGKIPLSLYEGKSLRLGRAFLYSTPGETGELHLTGSDSFRDHLRATGMDSDMTDNLARAFSNLSYTALKFDLRPESDGDMALTMKVEGSASEGRVTVPVSVAVTFHGDIHRLINMSLKTIRKRDKYE